MKWAPRARVHVDRAACAWLIRRFIDPAAEFVFVGGCTFETALTHFDLADDPALEEIGHIVHEAVLSDESFDAPVAAGLAVLIRGLTLTSTSDQETPVATDRLFDGLYEHIRQHLLSGRTPS
jgi:hypothetical protein